MCIQVTSNSSPSLSPFTSPTLSLSIHIYLPPSPSPSFPTLPEVDMAHHHRGTHSTAAQKVTECSYVSGKFQQIKWKLRGEDQYSKYLCTCWHSSLVGAITRALGYLPRRLIYNGNFLLVSIS